MIKNSLLKPQNIMLVPRKGGEIGRLGNPSTVSSDAESTIVKLFDFGLSRSPRMGFGPSATDTGDGVILGTPGYMAPEQFHGQGDRTSDVFSLGVTLYELLTLTPAWRGAHLHHDGG